MNYDPTLRNIKAKYLNKEEIVLGYKKSFEVQVGHRNLIFITQSVTSRHFQLFENKKKGWRVSPCNFGPSENPHRSSNNKTVLIPRGPAQVLQPLQ